MFSFLKGNIRTIIVSRTNFGFFRQMAFPYFSLYVLALGGTPASVGFVSSLLPLASLLILPIAGYIADRTGRVKLLYLGAYCTGLTCLLYIFANNWIMLAIGNFIMGLIVFQFPAQSALIADSLSPNQRGIGYATLRVIPGAVAVIAPYLGGFLIDEIGVDSASRYLFTLVLIAYLISGTILRKFLVETVDQPNLTISISALKTFITESYRSVWVTLKWMPFRLRALAIMVVLGFMANAFAEPLWIIYGTRVIGLSPSEWGLLIIISTAFGILVSIPAGAIVDRFGKRKTIISSFTVTLFSILSFTYAKGFMDLLFILLILFASNEFLASASSALIADMVPRERRGRVMAAIGRGALFIGPGRGGTGTRGPGMGVLTLLPVMFGSLIGGYIYDINPQYPWILQLLVFLGCLIIGVALLREPENAEI